MIEKIEENEFLKHFSAMGEAANFFLLDSFSHAEREMNDKIAGELFGVEIAKIPATAEDHKVDAKVGIELKNATLADLLAFDNGVLSEWTTNKFAEIWAKAQRESLTVSMQFPLQTKLDGRELLGHVTPSRARLPSQGTLARRLPTRAQRVSHAKH